MPGFLLRRCWQGLSLIHIFKLSDALEERIEEMVLSDGENIPIKTGEHIGKVSYVADKASEDYIDHLESSIHEDLHGLRILVDCRCV